MPRKTKATQGEKITLNDDIAGYDKGTEVEVKLRHTGDDGVVVADVNGNGFWVADEDYTRVPKTRKAAKKAAKKTPKVATPNHTISQDEIIGQDINKSNLEVAISKDMPVLLIGDTGTGKTSIIRELAGKHGKDIARFSITGETTVDEFVGKYELENGQTVWKDGILLDAMQHGKWLVCDEVNVALPEILFVLHSLLDDDHFVTVTNHNHEVKKPHKDFRFFATMNPPEEYAGTKELNKAFLSRFPMILTLHYPPANVEAKIISDKTGVDLTDATKMADVAVALRKAKKEEKIFYTCSTRDLIHWGKLCDVLDPGEAFRVSILNKVGQEAEQVYDIYSHIIKRYIQLEQPSVELTVDWFEKEAQKIVDERKQFEKDKDDTRKKITQEIIAKLTAGESVHEPTAVDAVAEEKQPVPVDADLDDIFSGDLKG